MTVDGLSNLAPAHRAKILLNVQSDDYGVVEERRCGCHSKPRLPTHVRGVRSYKKLIGEGVTLVGSDMERVIERVLPARFGGSALDYQLAEEEDARGFTRILIGSAHGSRSRTKPR